jgi:prevent-host-death family protein
MPKIVNLHAAKTHLSRLVDEAAAGQEIVIAKAGTPVARLVMFRKQAKPRKPGLLKGQIRIAKDFDAPLPADVMKLFEGE